MSETPTDAAMEAARKYEKACLHTPCAHICRRCHAASLTAYAAECVSQAADVAAQYTSSAALQNAVVDRLAEAEAERDAAIARAEAAEKAEIKIAMKVVHAEERARVLEASQVQVARLRAKVNEALQLLAEAPVEAIDAIMDAHNEDYPADLLAAVRVIVIDDSYKAERRAAVATLAHYGLLEEKK